MIATLYILISVITAVCLHITCAQDCSSLLGSSSKKRLLFDDILNVFNRLPDQIKDILPASAEVDARCRFNLTNIKESQTQLMKSLYRQGYSVCLGCSQTDSDYGRCDSIKVCGLGTSCIQGLNEHLIPSYIWHGCCEDSDPLCKSSTFVVDVSNFGKNFSLSYRKIVCKGFVCNKDFELQVSLSSGSSTSSLTTLPIIPSSATLISTLTTMPIIPSPPTPMPALTTKHIITSSAPPMPALTTMPIASTTTNTKATITTTRRPVATTNPTATRCAICAGPPEACEVAYYEDYCQPPDNYCINNVTNLDTGVRLVERKCGNLQTCYREWYQGSSDDDKCRQLSESTILTYYFECTFCYVKDGCNVDLHPKYSTLYTAINNIVIG